MCPMELLVPTCQLIKTLAVCGAYQFTGLSWIVTWIVNCQLKAIQRNELLSVDRFRNSLSLYVVDILVTTPNRLIHLLQEDPSLSLSSYVPSLHSYWQFTFTYWHSALMTVPLWMLAGSPSCDLCFSRTFKHLPYSCKHINWLSTNLWMPDKKALLSADCWLHGQVIVS